MYYNSLSTTELEKELSLVKARYEAFKRRSTIISTASCRRRRSRTKSKNRL